MTNLKILFQGDSITDGGRYKDESSRWDLNHQIGHSYAYIINGLLGFRYPEKGLCFVNRGVSGNKIADIYERRKIDIFDIRPDVLSILIGTNDHQTEKAAFYDSYSRLLYETKQALSDVRLILMGCFCFGDEDRRRIVASHAESAEKLAAEYGALFIGYQHLFDAAAEKYGEKYWIWDGIHPTENGHGLIADEWIRKAVPFLGL